MKSIEFNEEIQKEILDICDPILDKFEEKINKLFSSIDDIGLGIHKEIDKLITDNMKKEMLFAASINKAMAPIILFIIHSVAQVNSKFSNESIDKNIFDILDALKKSIEQKKESLN